MAVLRPEEFQEKLLLRFARHPTLVSANRLHGLAVQPLRRSIMSLQDCSYEVSRASDSHNPKHTQGCKLSLVICSLEFRLQLSGHCCAPPQVVLQPINSGCISQVTVLCITTHSQCPKSSKLPLNSRPHCNNGPLSCDASMPLASKLAFPPSDGGLL